MDNPLYMALTDGIVKSAHVPKEFNGTWLSNTELQWKDEVFVLLFENHLGKEQCNLEEQV